MYKFIKDSDKCIFVVDCENIKMEALQKELSRSIMASLDLNLHQLMDEVLERTRIRMTRSEINSFINRRVKNNFKLEISDDGSVEIVCRYKK